MLRNEMKRTNKNPIILVFILLLPICWFLGTNLIRSNIQFITNSLKAATDNPLINPAAADVFQNQANSVNGFMVFIEGCSEFYIPVAVALLAGIVFSALFAYDKNTGFGNCIFTRASFKKYYLCKTVSVFISAFLAVFITMTLILLASLLIYSAKTPTQAFNFSMPENAAATRLFFEHYWLACFIMIITLSLSGGVYALLGMGVSLFTSNRFIISISPLAAYILCLILPQLFSTQSPVSKCLAWIFPSYFTGVFIGNDYWYTKLPAAAAYFIHLAVIVVPTGLLLFLLYRKNQRQYIK